MDRLSSKFNTQYTPTSNPQFRLMIEAEQTSCLMNIIYRFKLIIVCSGGYQNISRESPGSSPTLNVAQVTISFVLI